MLGELQGRTVVTTIHQPNSSITRCFDDLLLLAGGNLVYSGKWASSVEYFNSLGFRRAPPPCSTPPVLRLAFTMFTC